MRRIPLWSSAFFLFCYLCNMEQNNIIALTENFVRETLKGAEGGHDWFHIERVWRLAKRIAVAENAYLLVVELAALLPEVAADGVVGCCVPWRQCAQGVREGSGRLLAGRRGRRAGLVSPCSGRR